MDFPTIYLRGSDMCQGMSGVETLGLPVLELTETPPEVLLLNRELLRLLEHCKIFCCFQHSGFPATMLQAFSTMELTKLINIST